MSYRDIKTKKIFPGWGERFLSERVEESKNLIAKIATESDHPLLVQFSGGNDSMVMLDLVRQVTDKFLCCYMATGLEFKGVIQFVRDIAKKMGADLLVSNPSMHKGNIFKRIEQFQNFPGLVATWCCRDLKLRPQKKLLEKNFGKKAKLYKLEGVRLSESIRRRSIYKEYTGSMIRPDSEYTAGFEVFPIVNWTDADVTNYIEWKGLPVTKHYREFGVSGCSWCPFYEADIYRRILKKMPNHYDRFIEWEERLGMPCVSNFIYMGDLKKGALTGEPVRSRPPAERTKNKKPCTMIFEGKEVKTCDVYGHFYLDSKCYRCGEKETTQ